MRNRPLLLAPAFEAFQQLSTAGMTRRKTPLFSKTALPPVVAVPGGSRGTARADPSQAHSGKRRIGKVGERLSLAVGFNISSSGWQKMMIRGSNRERAIEANLEKPALGRCGVARSARCGSRSKEMSGIWHRQIQEDGRMRTEK
jgi:hypothetical protein